MWGFHFLLYNPVIPAQPPDTEALQLLTREGPEAQGIPSTKPNILPLTSSRCSSWTQDQVGRVNERSIFSLARMSSCPHSASAQEGVNQIWFAFFYGPICHIVLAHVS